MGWFDPEWWRNHDPKEPIPTEVLDDLESNLIDAPVTRGLIAEIRRLTAERDEAREAARDFFVCVQSEWEGVGKVVENDRAKYPWL